MKNWAALFVCLGLSSALGCGVPASEGGAPLKESLTADATELESTVREGQSNYPKSMMPAFYTPDRTFNWGQDYRYSYPGTFAITAPPSVSVRSPGEWETKQALLVAWTGNFGDVVGEIVSSAKGVTDVTVVYDSAQSLDDFKYQMQSRGVSTSGLTYVQLPIQTLWMRDYGPLSVEANGKLGFVDLRYYPGRLYDDAFPQLLSQKWNLNNFRMPLEFEGGNFMSDGAGTCYASTALFERNPGSSESQIRSYFDRYLGCEQTIFLAPLYGEGTGHIDMFTKLASKNTIILGKYRSSQSDYGSGAVDSVNAQILDNNAAKLSNVTLLDGSKLTIKRMPMPTHQDYNFRTYVNTQFINGVNMIPVYSLDDRYQDEALAIWQEAMPQWQHVAIDATQLITWAGAIHCILMEVGEGTRSTFQMNPETICSHFDCSPTLSTSAPEPTPEPEPEPTEPEPSPEPSSCGAGEVADCDGTCAPSNWLGDTYCDDGSYAYNGSPINFSCEAFSYDRGDCQPEAEGCGAGEILDCRNQCAPESWLGDGYCDAGGYIYQATGQPVYFNCSAYQNDGGDC